MAADPRWSRWRVRAGYPVALLYFWLVHPAPAALAAGAALALAGLLVRALAAGYLKKQEALATAGPYAWTRNPLYLGSALMGLGLALAGNNWLAAALVAAYFVAFYPAVIRREEQELRERYGAAYDHYAREVPLFWPRPPRRREQAAPFSWALYLRNHEQRAAVGYLAALLLLLAKMLVPALTGG
jgi:protein-S-isoprenylcysteine O-methyltransferase Ste14